MATPELRNSDPVRRSSVSAPSSSSGIVEAASDFGRNGGYRENGSSSRMTLDGLMPTVSNFAPPSEPTVLGAQIALADAQAASVRTVNDVWREIVSDERRRVCKEEVPDEEMITLEDFLLRAGASADDEEEEVEVKDVKPVQPLPPSPPSHQLSGSMFAFEPKVEPSVTGFGNGVEVIGAGGLGLRGGKRGPPSLDPLDKAAQQRQRRMIKNRESAARSRERKQVKAFACQ